LAIGICEIFGSSKGGNGPSGPMVNTPLVQGVVGLSKRVWTHIANFGQSCTWAEEVGKGPGPLQYLWRAINVIGLS